VTNIVISIVSPGQLVLPATVWVNTKVPSPNNSESTLLPISRSGSSIMFPRQVLVLTSSPASGVGLISSSKLAVSGLQMVSLIPTMYCSVYDPAWRLPISIVVGSIRFISDPLGIMIVSSIPVMFQKTLRSKLSTSYSHAIN